MRYSRPLVFMILALAIVRAGLATEKQDPLRRAAHLGATWKSAPAPGVEVTSVRTGSAADKAGIQPGDRITAINGSKISNRAEFDALYEPLRAGDRITLDIVRGKDSLQRSIVLPPLPKEEWQGIDTRYDAVLSEKGYWLRSIVTKPANASGRIPGILVVGWLSCDSVEYPFGPTEGFGKLLRELILRSGFAMMRIDKPGVGDSGGPPCRGCDFETELAGYRAALRAFKNYDFVDPDRIVLLGMSNGGGFAPLVADKEQVRAYVVSGGWSKTWYEHMLELERRRLNLTGRSPGQISEDMKGFAEFYTHYLIEKMTPGEVTRKYPSLAPLWYDEPEHQYGRPAAFYQQLQSLNLAAAWDKVRAPVLVVYGEYDWIMSRADSEWIAEIVNRNNPGMARFVSIPKMDHGFTMQPDMHGSFENFGGGRFDDSVATLILDWLHQNVR